MRTVPLNRRQVRPTSQICLLLGALIVLAGLAGCSGGPDVGVGGSLGATTVTVLITSTANDQLSSFDMVLNSLTLTDRSGNTASLIPAPINAEFLHVNGLSEPLLSTRVPRGIYSNISASIGAADFTCVGLEPSDGNVHTAKFAYGYTPAANVTVNLPSPITISGTSEQLLLNLQVSRSATYDVDDCPSTGDFSITPEFTLAASNGNKLEVGLRGIVDTAPTATGSFIVTAADGQGCGASGCDSPVNGPAWRVALDADTIYQDASGPSQLVVGLPVEMDAALQPDGSLLAKRIAAYDLDPTGLSLVIGPGLRVPDTAPVYFPIEALGPLILDYYPFTFNKSSFQISGEFNNLQNLPFPTSFNATNVVPGQYIYATTHALQVEPSPNWVPATTVTLIPQTINGVVSSVGNEGGFTTYTITLAPYELFPQFAVQSGQTTLLTSPDTVVVYADGNTQRLNTIPISVGSVARFYGLIFNDNGTLRMDCAQTEDGVPE